MHYQSLQIPHIRPQDHLLYYFLILPEKLLTRIPIADNTHQLILRKTLSLQLQHRPQHRRHQLVLKPIHPTPLPRFQNHLVNQIVLNCIFGYNSSKMIFIPQSLEDSPAIA